MSRSDERIQKQAQNMTQEELQRTQVLNLQAFEEVARIEKMTSKKPAIIVAVIGMLSIFMGASFPVVESLSARMNQDEPKIEKRQVNNTLKTEDKTTKVNCSYYILNGGDGTNQTLDIEYVFNETDQLINFTKVYKIYPVEGNQNGQQAVQNFLTNLQPALIQQDGYQVSLSTEDTKTVVTTKVDYSKLDLTKLPDTQKARALTRVEYVANSAKDSVFTDMTKKGYKCTK